MELEQTNLQKFKCQGYCLGGECWSSELNSASGKAKLNTLLLREIYLLCCSLLLKVSLWNIPYWNHKNFQDLANPHLSTGVLSLMFYALQHNITQARATYCTKWNPWKFLMRYWLLWKKQIFSSFLAYLISKYYIANSIVLIKITLDKANWLW